MLPISRFDRRNTEPALMDIPARFHLTTRHDTTVDISSRDPTDDGVNEVDDTSLRNTEHSGDNEKRNMRNSALRIFGRYRRKKSVNPEILQVSENSGPTPKSSTIRLNDSKSATTEKKRRTSFRSFECRSPRRHMSELGTISVLKPVSEYTESFRLPSKMFRDSTQSDISIGSQAQNEDQASCYLERTSTPNHGTHSHPLKSHPRESEAPIISITTQREHRKSPLNDKWEGKDSTQTEYVRSGSSLSQSSKSTSSKAGQSELSTSRSTTPDPFPPRKSSKYYNSTTREEKKEVKINSNSVDEVRATTPPPKQTESSSVSPLIFGTGTAKLARSFSGAGIERACIVRCSSPSQHSSITATTPTNKTHSLHASRSTSPTSTLLKSEQALSPRTAEKRLSRTNTTTSQETDSYRNQSRCSGLTLLSDFPTPPSVTSQIAIPISTAKNVSISNIMTIATIAPDFEQFNEPSLVTIKRRHSKNWTTVPGIAIATALKPIGGEYDNSQYSLGKQRPTQSARCHESFFNSRVPRRPDRHTVEKERASTRDEDVNTRLNKMERDNEMLLATLNGIMKRISVMSAQESPSIKPPTRDRDEIFDNLEFKIGKERKQHVRNDKKLDDRENRVNFNQIKF